MKVLIFGSGDSIWIKSVVEHTLLKFHDEVTIISTTSIEKYKNYYEDNSVKIISYKTKNGRFGSLVSALNYISYLDDAYDLLCVHFVRNSGMLFSLFARHRCKKNIFCFWGSDLLRTKKGSMLSRLSFSFADRIGLTTNEMNEKFHDLYGCRYDKKIRRILFGSNVIDLIKNQNFDTQTIREKYGIDSGKIVVAIGYNRMVEQQHLRILNSINTLPNDVRRKLHILLKLTYGGGGSEYIDAIKQTINQKGYSSTVIETYLDDIEVAELTAITDVFIQGQITDARSASMCEHLYAGALVINPSWLCYSELRDKVFFLEYNTFDELEKMLQGELNKKHSGQYVECLKKNKDVIYDYCSWETFVPAWRNLYEK